MKKTTVMVELIIGAVVVFAVMPVLFSSLSSLTGNENVSGASALVLGVVGLVAVYGIVKWFMGNSMK